MSESRLPKSENGSAGRVYVVGSGLAGLSAVFAALENGAEVVLVEKADIGGNSAKATSGINAVHSKFQKIALEEQMKTDSIDLFLADTLRSGKGECDRRLAHILTALSGESIDALDDKFNLTLSDVNLLGGQSAPRTHRFPPKDGRIAPVGWTIINTLKSKLLAEQSKIQILLKHALIDFQLQTVPNTERSYVSTITLQDLSTQPPTERTFSDVKALILAAGGYAADSSPQSLLVQYSPELQGFPTTNGPFATGDTLKLAINKKIKTTQLDHVQLHPTGFVLRSNPAANHKFLCPEVMRGVGGVLVNEKGDRFVDELSTRDVVSKAVIKNCGDWSGWKFEEVGSSSQKIATLVMSLETAERFGLSPFSFYKSKGFIFDLHDAESFSKNIKTFSIERLWETLEAYNAAAEKRIPDPFGKTSFPATFDRTQPLFGAFVTPSLHFTMGGIAIDSDGRALVEGGEHPILNLFVAGENVGGTHGANRLGGNGCLESLVFGRLAGHKAGVIDPHWDHQHLPHQNLKYLESTILHVDRNPDNSTTLRIANISPIHILPPTTTTVKRLTIGHGDESMIVASDVKVVHGEAGYFDVQMKTAENVHPGYKVSLELR